MPCAENIEALSAWLDEELEATESERIKDHLAHCAECRGVVADLSAIKTAAVTLSLDTVTDKGWPLLERKLVRLQPPYPSKKRSWSWMVAAAALFIAMISAAAFHWGHLSAEKRAQRELTLLINQQQRTFQALLAVVQSQETHWDPKLQETFSRNAALVDAAIEECRRAVHERPTDLALRASLMEAYQRKVDFLKVFSGLEDAP